MADITITGPAEEMSDAVSTLAERDKAQREQAAQDMKKEEEKYKKEEKEREKDMVEQEKKLAEQEEQDMPEPVDVDALMNNLTDKIIAALPKPDPDVVKRQRRATLKAELAELGDDDDTDDSTDTAPTDGTTVQAPPRKAKKATPAATKTDEPAEDKPARRGGWW